MNSTRRVTDHLFEGAAEALGTVGVDGEQGAGEVVRADHAERAFDELTVAGLALAQGGLGGALDGDVDAGGDDEADLALLVMEQRWADQAMRRILPLRCSH